MIPWIGLSFITQVVPVCPRGSMSYTMITHVLTTIICRIELPSSYTNICHPPPPPPHPPHPHHHPHPHHPPPPPSPLPPPHSLSGAAAAAGTSYTGALVVTRDGQWPVDMTTKDSPIYQRIEQAMNTGGNKMWELFQVVNEEQVGLGPEGPPPLEIE